MTPEAILIGGGILYVLSMTALVGWLFPRGQIQVICANDCSHQVRRPYEPEYSVGDESDYHFRCARCGCVLRWEPNA